MIESVKTHDIFTIVTGEGFILRGTYSNMQTYIDFSYYRRILHEAKIILLPKPRKIALFRSHISRLVSHSSFEKVMLIMIEAKTLIRLSFWEQ